MAKIRISPPLLIGLILVAIFCVSLVYRIYPPYGDIFVGDTIKHGSNDAYFYMSLIDNVCHHFPQLTQFDPYFIYPGGNIVVSLPFFHWMIAFFSWVGGAGNPTQHLIDLIGVYLPAILGALTVIPVFFIGKTLFNKWVGVLAAAMIAILPGEFLSRSMLGSGDNPVAEVFFTTTALMFLILAIKAASQHRLSFNHLIKRDWKVILKPLIFSILGGIFLGFYLTTWQGALIFIFIFIIYLIIQFIIDHIKRKSSEYLCIIGFTTLLFALILLLINPMSTDITYALIVALFIPPVLWGISKFIATRGLKPYSYPLTLVVVGILAVVIFYFAAPGTYNTLLAKFKFVFFPVGSTAITTLEMTPVLIPIGTDFTTAVAWGNFTTSFFIAPWWLIFAVGAAAACGYLFYLNNKSMNGVSLLIFYIIAAIIMIILSVQQIPNQYNLMEDQVKFIPGIAFIGLSVLFYLFIKQRREQAWYVSSFWIIVILVLISLLVVFTTYSDIRYLALVPLAILIYILFKQSDGDEHLRFFIIWCLIILIIPMIQRRFQYYLAVNFAVLSGYLSWQIIRLSGVKNLAAKPEAAKENVHISKTKMKRRATTERRSKSLSYVNVVLSIILVLLFVFSPNMTKSQAQAQRVDYALSDEWQAALEWMRDNTPDPMGDPDAYYKLYDPPPPGEEFQYPESAYGVTAWWDYGYWIIRIAHRIPNVNPSQSPGPIKKVATFFLSQNQTTRDEIRKELGSKYIIIDYDIATGKYWAIINWAGYDQEKYLPIFYQPQGEQLFPVQVYSTNYYQTLLVRLYNFDGKAVAGGNAIVITYQDARDINGILYKHILGAQEFPSYQEALDYIATQDASKKYEIVSQDAFNSPIPLDAVEDYKLVYSSPTSDNTTPAPIKIFEYIGDDW